MAAQYNWYNAGSVGPKAYTCSYCSQNLASGLGYYSMAVAGYIVICHFCTCPTFIDTQGNQHLGAPFGATVSHLPDAVAHLYDEARNCIKVNAYTSSVLACRKLLMNIAVSNEAVEGKNFVYYVDWLETQHYIPPNGKAWVDRIRKDGNVATHEIRIMSKEEAERLIKFIENLLRFIYEFPAEAMK